MNEWSCFLTRVGMLGTTLDYLAQLGPLATIIEVFLGNGLSFISRNTAKWWSGRSSIANIPGLETWNFSVLVRTFSREYAIAQHSIPLLSAGTTLVPSFCSGRFLAREEILMRIVILWFIGFYGAVHLSHCWRGLGVTVSGLTFLTSPISTIMLWCTPQISTTHHWAGPRGSVCNRHRHLLTPALVTGSP